MLKLDFNRSFSLASSLLLLGSRLGSSLALPARRLPAGTAAAGAVVVIAITVVIMVIVVVIFVVVVTTLASIIVVHADDCISNSSVRRVAHLREESLCAGALSLRLSLIFRCCMRDCRHCDTVPAATVSAASVAAGIARGLRRERLRTVFHVEVVNHIVLDIRGCIGLVLCIGLGLLLVLHLILIELLLVQRRLVLLDREVVDITVSALRPPAWSAGLRCCLDAMRRG